MSNGIQIGRLFFPVLLCFSAVHAQQPQVDLLVKSSVKEVIEGGRIEVTYNLVGSAEGILRKPRFAPFKQIGAVVETTGMQFIQSAVVPHRSWVFTLKAPKPGTYTIPPASVAMGGRTYASLPLVIEVLPSSKVRLKTVIPPGADPNIFVVSEFNCAYAYPGQQVGFKVNIYTRKTVVGSDLLVLPKVPNCYQEEMKRANFGPRVAMVRGNEYATKTLYAGVLYPAESGKITVPSVQVRAGIENPDLPGGVNYTVLTAPDAVLTIRALPDSLPLNFTNVTGQYEYSLSKDRDSLVAGEALTLTLRLTGNGDPHLYKLPMLDLTDGWEVLPPTIKKESSYENGKEFVHSKIVEYVAIAKRSGTYALEPSISWFNVDSNRIAYWKPNPPLIVAVRQAPDTNIAVVPVYSGDGAGEPLSWWQHPTFVGSAALLTALMLGGVVFFWYRRQEKPVVQIGHTKEQLSSHDVFIEPQDVSNRVAEGAPKYEPVTSNGIAKEHPIVQSLLELKADGADPKSFFEALYAPLRTEVSKRLDLSASWDRVALEAGFVRRNLPPLQATTIRHLLDTCELAIFGGQAARFDQDAIIEDARVFFQEHVL